MRRGCRTLLTLAALAIGPSLALADSERLIGKVVGVSDGDTMTLLVQKTPIKIRLANIDAPEKAQPFGNLAKQALSDLAFGKEVECDKNGLDRYGRSIATCYQGGTDINAEMLRLGMAWVYRKYAKNSVPDYYKLEAEARNAQIGLWRDYNAIPPWDWRKGVTR